MNLQDANDVICSRMENFVREKQLKDAELRIGCDYSDAVRYENGSNDPTWFAAHRELIASNLKGNVLTIITAARQMANTMGKPVTKTLKNYLKPEHRIGTEEWRRGAMRRHLTRLALHRAFTEPLI